MHEHGQKYIVVPEDEADGNCVICGAPLKKKHYDE